MKSDYTDCDMAAFGFVPFRGHTKFTRDELARNERVQHHIFENQRKRKPKDNIIIPPQARA